MQHEPSTHATPFPPFRGPNSNQPTSAHLVVGSSKEQRIKAQAGSKQAGLSGRMPKGVQLPANRRDDAKRLVQEPCRMCVCMGA